MTDMSGAVLIRLEEARKEKGLTQAQLADLAGVTRQTVIALERGGVKAIEVGTIQRISDALGHMGWIVYTPDPALPTSP